MSFRLHRADFSSRSRTLFALACLVAGAALLAPAAGASTAGFHYSGRVDIDPAAGALSADLRLTGVAIEPGQETVGFLLNGALGVEAVEGPAVRSYASEPLPPEGGWHRIAVRIEPESEATTTEFRFVYSGSPTMPESRINRITPDWVELSVDAAWHPIIETVDRAFTARIEIGLPNDWTVVASGEATAREDGFVLDSTVSQVDIAFVAAPGLDRELGDGFEVYYRDETAETRAAVLRAATACRDALDRRFAAGGRLPTGRLVLTDRDEGGYARKNFIALTDVAGHSESRLTEFLCHELAHFWSSGAKPLTVDNWLNEGFAVFVAAEITRDLQGEQAHQALIEHWGERAVDQPSIWTPEDQTRRPFEVNYKKAPLALLRLQRRIGPEAFDSWLTQYMTEPINDTPRLLEALEARAGVAARRWFESVLAESTARPD